MISSAVLFILYTCFFALILHLSAKKNKLGINSELAVSAFLFKVLMGCLYGYLMETVYGGDDTWNFHALSLEETTIFKRNPVLYIKNMVRIDHYVQEYEMTQMWESVQYGTFIKMLAIFNIFSGGAYYVNVVFFNILSFWGAYSFYLLFKNLFTNDGFLLKGLVFFFLPLVFWTSGVRKDGMVFLSLGLYLYGLSQYLIYKKLKYIFLFLTGITILCLNRSLLILTLLPASAAWYLSIKTKWKPNHIQITTAVLILSLYFILPLDLLSTLIRKNNEFHLLSGTSRVELNALNFSFTNFFQTFPQAFTNVFFKPLPFSFKSPLIFLSGVETIMVLIAVLCAIVFPKNRSNDRFKESAVSALIAICLVNYMVIGYIVPFMGAVIRYRIVFELILLTTCLMLTDWEKIRKYILNKFTYQI